MDIKFIKGVGEKRAEAFRKVGVNKIEDFLNFIPRAYLRRFSVSSLKDAVGVNVLVTGKIIDINYPSKSNHPVTLYLEDNTGIVEIPVFGATEFRSRQFRLNETYIFSGKVSEPFWKISKIRVNAIRLDYRDHLKINLADPNDEDFLKFNFIPVYELQGELKKTWIRQLTLSKIVFNAFRILTGQSEKYFSETLPENVIEEAELIPKKEAVIRINFPLKTEDIEISRKRLSFEELFYLQLLLALKRRSIKNEVKGISFSADVTKMTDDFKKSLKFQLTNAQEKAIKEIYSDMNSGHVMNRLLQGDVGSGKTIVSLYGMLVAAENSYQSALMCPTEILAEQHFSTISKFIEDYNSVSGKEYKLTLLVGGQKKRLREQLLQDIRLGKSNIVIGTHALIQESVEFAKLGFVVIDEQHKFGVMQRAKLKEKGLNPDVLVMTATPIPRTLSLTYYGDLDVSVIDELPSGRKPVKTALRSDSDKDKVYDFVRKSINEGRQIFIIYPIIDESEKLDLKSAEENYKLLKEKIFKDYKVGMVHGRMFWYEIEEEMKAFKEGKINILVATTVVEVGLDIPNATIMIIEDAQRYGLSQLHQLRGRVGRGREQSYCILIAKNLDEVSAKRLNTLCETNDGFKIAEVDMEIRGPGEFFGIKQSGVLNFSCTDLNRDRDILTKARKIAFEIIETDPQLRKPNHEKIRNTLLENYKDALYLMTVA